MSSYSFVRFLSNCGRFLFIISYTGNKKNFISRAIKLKKFVALESNGYSTKIFKVLKYIQLIQ